MFLAGIAALVALGVAIHALSRVHELEARERRWMKAIDELAARVAALAGASHPEEKGARPAPSAAPAAPPTVEPPAAAPPEPRPAPYVPPPPVVPPPPPVARPAPPPPPPPSRPPTSPPPPRPSLPPRRPPTPPVKIDWEGLVGVKLFSWISGVALVLAAVFFVRYSIEHGWLSNSVKMAIGLAVGTGLLVLCELPAARRYAVTANALDAAGIAVLFLTFFASHALWDLLPTLPTFMLMALVTAVAVALSIRRESVYIALLGLVGGFATPALLSTGENRPIGLFGYLLLLNVGLAWVAYQKRWVVLTVVSIVVTALYQWIWVLRFLTTAQVSLGMGIFLVFPIVHMAALLLAERTKTPPEPMFGRMALTAAVLPLVFVLYLAAVPAYGANVNLLFGFVLLVGAGLAAVGVGRGPALVHLLGGAGTVAAFAVWCGASYASAAWPHVLAWVALAVVLYLVVPSIAARLGRSLGDASALARLVAPVLLFVFPFFAYREPAAASPGPLFATLFALAALIAAVAVANEDGAPHFVAALFAVAAEAAWASRHLEADRLYSALLLFGAFGLFYVAVPVIAARAHKRLDRGAGSGLVLLASLGLLLFLAAGPVAHAALFGIAALLALLNLGLLVTTVGRGPALRWVGIVASWVVLAVWWVTAMTVGLLLPVLVVVAGFALLVLGGNAWSTSRAPAGAPGSRGIGLALVAYAFLLRIALDPALGLPPWPLFAVLGVLDLAIAIAALAIRDGRPHLAAVVASQVVVLVWAVRADVAPWPLAALAAVDAVVILALAWTRAAVRRRAPLDVFAQAAVVGVGLAQVTAIVAANLAGAPGVGWLVAEHTLLLVALLALAAETGWHVLALLAVVPTTLATGLWASDHLRPESWTPVLVFAAAPYVVLLANAFLVRRRAGSSRHPFAAATAAGVVFLGIAYRCARTGGWTSVAGVVPLAQAVATMGLLRLLLAERTLPLEQDGRIALVAASALGFITAVIPIQLSSEWITVAWAIEAAALAWLYRRIRFPQLRWWIAGVATAVLVRLTLNPAVLTYHPRTATPIWNFYLYTYGVPALAFFVAATILRSTDDRPRTGLPRLSSVLPAAGTLLLFLLLNIEIADFFSEGETLAFDFFSSSLPQDLSYTIGWALFAIVLLGVGIRLASRTTRVTALGLLVVTILKAFLHDLWRLGGLYRVGSFVGLAICLSLVAVLLQRFVFVPKEEA
jgi:uncharacterized membrane protein